MIEISVLYEIDSKAFAFTDFLYRRQAYSNSLILPIFRFAIDFDLLFIFISLWRCIDRPRMIGRVTLDFILPTISLHICISPFSFTCYRLDYFRISADAFDLFAHAARLFVFSFIHLFLAQAICISILLIQIIVHTLQNVRCISISLLTISDHCRLMFHISRVSVLTTYVTFPWLLRNGHCFLERLPLYSASHMPPHSFLWALYMTLFI